MSVLLDELGRLFHRINLLPEAVIVTGLAVARVVAATVVVVASMKNSALVIVQMYKSRKNISKGDNSFCY